MKNGILKKYKKLNKISIYFVQLSMDFKMHLLRRRSFKLAPLYARL